jgi:hypothetical protein
MAESVDRPQALVHPGAGKSAQNGVGLTGSPDAVGQLLGREGLVAVGNKDAKDGVDQGGVRRNEVGKLRAVRAQNVLDAVFLAHFGRFGVDGVNDVFAGLVGDSGLVLGAQVAGEVDAELTALALPPVEVNMEFGLVCWLDQPVDGG